MCWGGERRRKIHRHYSYNPALSAVEMEVSPQPALKVALGQILMGLGYKSQEFGLDLVSVLFFPLKATN